MKETRAAIRYAKALLDLSIDQKKDDGVNKDMLLIAGTISENKDLQIMLKSPVIKAKSKKDVLMAIFKTSVNNISEGLILQLIENKRLELLGEIAKQYTIIYDYHKGTQVAKVTSAYALTADLKAKVLQKITDLVGKKVDLENIVDPSLIGGFVLRVGDKQFDASISGKLNKLRREFDDNLYVPKM